MLFDLIFGLFAIFVLPGLVCEWAEKLIWKDDNSETRPTNNHPPVNYHSAAELQRRLEQWLTVVEKAGAHNKWKYGRDYERYIGWLFEREGYYVVYNGAVEGRTDGGIDLFACKDGFIHLIQCKRWQNVIGREQIEKFANAVDRFERHRSRYASVIPACYSKCKVFPMFYATNGYTDEAFDEADWSGISLRTQPFRNIRQYPPVKCTILKGKKVYYLPFDRDFDKVHIGVYRGGCYKFTVFEAEQAGFRYVHNPEHYEPATSKPAVAKPKPQENYAGLKIAAVIVAGIFLFAAGNSSKSKSSSPPTEPSRTYVHDDFRPTTKKYSAPEPTYHPIEFDKLTIPKSAKLPDVQPPILNVAEPIEIEPLEIEPVEENIAELPDKLSPDLPKSLDSLNSESRRKELEAEMDAAQKRAQTYIEANQERWDAEVKAAQDRAEAYIEANRERWEAEMEAARRQFEESRRRSPNSLTVFNEPEPISLPEESILLPHKKTVSSWRYNSFDIP